MTVEKGGTGIQGHLGCYDNFKRTSYYYKKFTFSQLKEAISQCDNNYHLFFSNCKHFANALFESPLAKKICMSNSSNSGTNKQEKEDDFEKHEGYSIIEMKKYDDELLDSFSKMSKNFYLITLKLYIDKLFKLKLHFKN